MHMQGGIGSDGKARILVAGAANDETLPPPTEDDVRRRAPHDRLLVNAMVRLMM